MARKKKLNDLAQMALIDASEELNEQQVSQLLSSVIKSSRDIMRKDKGLSSDAERLPMLTWIMFLKFLDDVEQHREVESELSGKSYRPIIEAPYRWRDWASPKNPTGQDLLAFIEQEEVVLPNGERGPGLFFYLRNLRGDAELAQRDVIASVFQETYNRMTKGYLLKDILLKVDTLDFGSSKQIHVMGRLYETMLKEMRDAAGDAGEFYTPRPVIKFMVEAISPSIGDTILDPAAGTGGFLVESFELLKMECSKAEDIEVLQSKTLFGIEAKNLPYLLCQMNMLLHGINSSNVIKGNSLTTPLREIGDRDRVDIILTNPPFGGEEEKTILRNFPKDKQTIDTALLFLQLLMRKIKHGKARGKGGKCGVIVPDGVLFNIGVGTRVRSDLLKNFDLHTIIRLPEGVFAPYTGIRTNILFFKHPGPTTRIWFYELPPPADRKSYTKTKPIDEGDFQDLLNWWNNRKSTSESWTVSVKDLDDECTLDLKNPSGIETMELKPPAEIIAELISANEEIKEQLAKLSASFDLPE